MVDEERVYLDRNNVKLFLRKDEKVINRHIGSLHKNVMWHDGTRKEDVFMTDRSKSEHYAIDPKGYGLNAMLIEDFNFKFDFIIFTAVTVKLFVSREFVLQHCEKGFLGDSFEEQYFVSPKDMVEIKRSDYSNLYK